MRVCGAAVLLPGLPGLHAERAERASGVVHGLKSGGRGGSPWYCFRGVCGGGGAVGACVCGGIGALEWRCCS